MAFFITIKTRISMDFSSNRVCELFGITYPIIQGGMVWCSGWKLAAAVSNAGGLGLIGAGSMHPDNLRHHIQSCSLATDKPFGVNIPLLYPQIEEMMQITIEQGVKIVFTSAGNPATWTQQLKDKGITVVHVVPNVRLARKCVDSGVDAVVCEGFEAGGHNGKDELTTMVLTPQVVDAIGNVVPVIAAGGIGDARAFVAAMALGADGIQVGSRFAVTVESSAHPKFKQRIIESDDTQTVLALKQITPVRLLKNPFYENILEAERRNASSEELRSILGKGRAKKGIFEGDLIEGELEVGQVSGLIVNCPTVSEVMISFVGGYARVIKAIS
jgi:enoyl-[acyl-carrier protein] reductase II